ncbi:cadherin-like beta sandwich domain-containing protein [Cohnella cellulosilytica]|uniref:Cadherin-like beta sandwich domain-containing protein n=1 Tax=Cohnella cellulosilytica TaxID=986710 RepID=A0ABW2FBM6_9BACL
MRRVTALILASLLVTTGLPALSGGQAYAAGGGLLVTVAGTGNYGDSGDGGAATDAEIMSAMNIAVDSVGNLYIADIEASRIRKVEKSSGKISTVAGTGVAGFSGDGGYAVDAQINRPYAVAFDSKDTLYIADSSNGRIRKVDSEGKISTIAGTGAFGFSGDGGPALLAEVWDPVDLAFDSSDNLYFIDGGNHRVRRIDKATGEIDTVAGNGSFGYSGDGMPATTAQLNLPYGLAIDGNDNLYIGDTYSHRVRKVDHRSEIISTVAGTGDFGDSGAGGLATEALMFSPMGLAIDRSGNLIIADLDNYRVYRVNQSTGILTIIAGTGTADCAVNEGTAAEVALCYPFGVAVDGDNNVYISQVNFISRIDPSDDADLSGLTLSGGTLNPTFASNETSYAASVQNSVYSLTVRPTLSYADASVTVGGTAATSGTSSGSINLGVGDNTIPIVVTAYDGTTKTYTLTVTRDPSSDASLSGLALSSGSLSPAFASGTTGYAASVANGVSSITVAPTTSESNATVTVNGVGVASGAPSGAINLNVGANAIPIVVTAQDGATRDEYTVTVTREAAAPVGGGGGGISRSSDARLSGLTLSGGSLNPAFASDTTSYTANVAYNVSRITLTSITSDRYAAVKVSGTAVPGDAASGEIVLSIGDNPIAVTVTAEDGTTKTYTITVTRASGDVPPPVSRGALLNEKIADASKVREASLAALQTAAYKPFGDVKANSWSFEAIRAAQRLGIVQGRTDGSFHGGDSITRAEFAAMAANALHLDTASAANGVSTTFSDTKGHWAEPAIRALTAAGVIEGMGDGAFKPNRPISRAEISAILARLMVFDEPAGNVSFTDTTGSWARQWIELLAGVEVVKGGGDGKFNPGAHATREQAVAMILRMLTVCRNVDLQWGD